MPRGHYDRSAAKARKAEGVEANAPMLETDVAAKDVQVELAFWASVQNSKNISDLEDYLERFEDGHFADLARRRIKQLIASEAHGGDPADYKVKDAPFPKKEVHLLPTIPMPVLCDGEENPRYQLLAPFYAENDTLYPEGKEIEYLGPPNEHMFPLNTPARRFKKEQEEYLDACWAVKCKAEGKPVIPRPRELADQIEMERNSLRQSGGVVTEAQLPPTRPDLAKVKVANPNAARIGEVRDGSAFADRPTNAPILGRDGHRYQKMVDPANPHGL